MTDRPPVHTPAQTATLSEVSTAIEALYSDKPKLVKLQQYAKFRIRGIGRAAEGQVADDLLNEAVTLSLDGTRTWKRGSVDIVGHLIGVMDSVSSHWAEKVARRGVSTYTETDVIHVPEEGDEVSPLQEYPCNRASPERMAEAQSEVEQIRTAFSSDHEVTAILQALERGLNGPEIQVALSISKTQYETAMKRLRRKARDFEGS